MKILRLIRKIILNSKKFLSSIYLNIVILFCTNDKKKSYFTSIKSTINFNANNIIKTTAFDQLNQWNLLKKHQPIIIFKNALDRIYQVNCENTTHITGK